MQIISFLQLNAHPRVTERTPSVPENVTDQELFEAAVEFAREGGALLLENSKEKMLIVRGELHQEMRDFLHMKEDGFGESDVMHQLKVKKMYYLQEYGLAVFVG
ncbi:hypothetical protein ACLOJK_040683 [Asimina triloba]